jgi:HEPN domain-containing protein/predicted nucleotidyltransferase
MASPKASVQRRAGMRTTEVEAPGDAPATEEAAVAEAVGRLVEALHPERVYLFGSRTRGEAHADSDYDFMVVVPDETKAARLDLERTAYAALGGLNIANDVLVRTRASFEWELPVVASLAATIEREGRLLYGSTPKHREAVSPMELEQRKLRLTRAWLARVSEDLQSAERMAQDPMLPGAVAFHCQQAAEKALKAYLLWHDRPFRKTHKLQKLVDQCAEIAPEFASLREAAQKLTPYVVAGRYPPDEREGQFPAWAIDPSKEQAEEALRLAREIVAFIRNRFPAPTER